ncbi:MAG TPA: ABC transporter substrate-binding protein, partial [Deinococcales bacterium]|nr:ABC transporter substrate-binding protein [Deinococcales bacterium]
GERYFVDLSGYYPYDPAKARQLLKDAGYANGLTVTFTVTNEFPIERKTAEVYAAQLAKVGVTAKIELIPFATWLTRVFTNHDYQMTIIGHAEPFDLDRFADPNYYFGYNSKEYQQLNAEAIGTVNEVQRTAIYGRMQRLLARDAAAVFAFTAPYLAATRANVYGWWQNQPTPAMVCTTVFKTR